MTPPPVDAQLPIHLCLLQIDAKDQATDNPNPVVASSSLRPRVPLLPAPFGCRELAVRNRFSCISRHSQRRPAPRPPPLPLVTRAPRTPPTIPIILDRSSRQKKKKKNHKHKQYKKKRKKKQISPCLHGRRSFSRYIRLSRRTDERTLGHHRQK